MSAPKVVGAVAGTVGAVAVLYYGMKAALSLSGDAYGGSTPSGKRVVIIIEALPGLDRDELIQSFEQYVDDFNSRSIVEDISINGASSDNSNMSGSGGGGTLKDDEDIIGVGSGGNGSGGASSPTNNGTGVKRYIYLEIQVADKSVDDGKAMIYFSFPDTNIHVNPEYLHHRHPRHRLSISSTAGWEQGDGSLHMRSTPQFVSTDMLDEDQWETAALSDSPPQLAEDGTTTTSDSGSFQRTTSQIRFRRRCCVIPLPDNRIYRGVPEVVDRQLRCCNVANGIDVIYHAATASAFVDEGINNCSFYNCSAGVNTGNEGVLPTLHASPQRISPTGTSEFCRTSKKGWGMSKIIQSLFGGSSPTSSSPVGAHCTTIEEQTWRADDATRALVDEANESDGLRSLIHEAAFECVMCAPRYLDSSAPQSGMSSRVESSINNQPTHVMAGTLENTAGQCVPALCTMITDVTMRAELYLRDVTVSNQDVFVSDGIVADAVAAAALRHHGGKFSSLRSCIEETFGLDCYCVCPMKNRGGGDSSSRSTSASPGRSPVVEGAPTTYPIASIPAATNINAQQRRKISSEQELSDWLVEHRITFMSAMTTVSGSNRLESCFGSDAPNFAFLRCAFDSLLFVKVLYTLAVETYPDWSAETFGVYVNDMFSHDREEVISHHTRIFRALNKSRSGSISYEELCGWLARKLSTRSSLPPDQHLVASLMSIRLPLLLFLDRRSLWSNYLCTLKSVSDDEVHV